MLKLMKKMRKNERGMAAVEFALILPILATLLIGSFEFSEVYNVVRKVDKTTAITSDLVSQYDCLEQGELDGIIGTAIRLMQPYNTANMRISVWSVTRGPDDSDPVTVDWARQIDNGTYSSQNGSGDTNPFTPNLTTDEVPAGASRIVAEVEYEYDLPLNFLLNTDSGKLELDKRYLTVPRGQNISQQTVDLEAVSCP